MAAELANPATVPLKAVAAAGRGSVPDAVVGFAGRGRLPSLPARLDRCALVGSGSALLGSRLGPEIDSHDTVIRVNRLPSPRLYPDFGKRTDILMAEVMLLQDCSSYRDAYLGQDQETSCPFQGQQRCQYTSIIFRGLAARERFPRKDPGCIPKCNAPPGPACGEMAPDVRHAVQRFPAIGSHLPSAGFESFWTMAPLCNSIRLYGFGGGANADGHFMNQRTHNYSAEHRVLFQVVSGLYPDSGWEPTRGHPNRTDAYVRTFAWFRAHALRLLDAGNLSMAGRGRS